MTGSTSQTPSQASPEKLRLLHARLMGRIHRRLIITGGIEGACLGILVGAISIAAMRTGYIAPSLWWLLLLMAIAFTCAGALFRRLTGFDPSQDLESLSRRGEEEHRLERAFDLIDSLTDPTFGASDFELRQAHQAFQSALERVEELDPQGDRAPAWRRPPDFFLVAMVVLALLAVALIPLSDSEPSPPAFDASSIPLFEDHSPDPPATPDQQHLSFDLPEPPHQLYPRIDHLAYLYLLHHRHRIPIDRSNSPQ